MEYHQITLNEWYEWKRKLRQELNNVRTAFVRVGYVLRKIDETEAYKVGGYKSVAEFAEKEHGLNPSITSRWMAINREFSIGGYSEQLDERYLDMNASQLTEMLGLPMEDRELITPETSRAELRELRRFNRESESSGSGADTSPMYGAFTGFLENNPSVAEKVMECLRGGNAGSEHIAEAVAPSGSRMYRAGTKFITFQKSDIKVKVFGGNGAESVSWDEFAEIARRWADEKERKEPETGNGVGEAAVEGTEEDAGKASPEGSYGEVEESRGVDDERREEVDGGYNGEVGADGSLPESWADGDGDRAGDGIGGNPEGTSEGSGAENCEVPQGSAVESGSGSNEGRERTENECAEDDGSYETDGRGTSERGGSLGEGRETEGKCGTPGSGETEPAAALGVHETDNPANEEAEPAALPPVAEDPSYTAEEKESSGSLTDDFPFPENVEDVEESEAEGIAPAQLSRGNIVDEDGNPAEDEDEWITLTGRIFQAKQEVRFCIREIKGKVDYRKWSEALAAVDELVGYLNFLAAHDKEALG